MREKLRDKKRNEICRYFVIILTPVFLLYIFLLEIYFLSYVHAEAQELIRLELSVFKFGIR